jgi:hypothetical protein
MALAMHIQILQERGSSNSATDDELPKKHNEWPCIFQSVLLAHSPGLALSTPTAFLRGSMILCRYLATALKGMARLLRARKVLRKVLCSERTSESLDRWIVEVGIRTRDHTKSKTMTTAGNE